VFTHNTPHTGNGTQRAATRKRIVISVAAMSTAAAMGTALALAAPLSAFAATAPTSFASGQFLSGSIGGTDLGNIVALGGASAHNNGKQSSQVSRDPLTASALKTTVINQPNGVQLNLGDVVDGGALNEYAQANSDGTSVGASGAISNDGGIGAGSDGAVGGNATVDLDSLLNAKFASVLSDARLDAADVAAQADGKLSEASGKYSLSGLKLNFTSPAIAGLGDKVAASLDPVTTQLNSLGGATGGLAQAVNSVTTGVNPLLNVVGANATVNAKVTTDLDAALEPLLTGTYGNNGVSYNLKTGAVSVDLATLLDGKLNSEPVGTEVLSDAVIKEILQGITSTVTTLSDQIKAKAENALKNANVNVDVALDASTAQAPLTSKVCTNGTGATSSPVSGGLLGGLLGGTVGTGKVGDLLCSTTTKSLPDLNTSLDVNVQGTVDQIVNGNAPQATAKLNLLGAPASINANNIVSKLGTTLTNRLLSTNGAVGQLDSSLESKLVTPAVSGLLGTGSGDGVSVTNALTKALSVTLNNQDTDAGVFTETALRISALPATAGGLATVNLAAAAVGPNVTTVIPTAPGDPGTPGAPGTPGTTGTTGTTTAALGSLGNPVTPAALGSLAFTGLGIGTLVAVILALLAAGAYLVREGYRRNSRRSNA
jgi:hypothetical protein